MPLRKEPLAGNPHMGNIPLLYKLIHLLLIQSQKPGQFFCRKQFIHGSKNTTQDKENQ